MEQLKLLEIDRDFSTSLPPRNRYSKSLQSDPNKLIARLIEEGKCFYAILNKIPYTEKFDNKERWRWFCLLRNQLCLVTNNMEEQASEYINEARAWLHKNLSCVLKHLKPTSIKTIEQINAFIKTIELSMNKSIRDCNNKGEKNG